MAILVLKHAACTGGIGRDQRGRSYIRYTRAYEARPNLVTVCQADRFDPINVPVFTDEEVTCARCLEVLALSGRGDAK